MGNPASALVNIHVLFRGLLFILVHGCSVLLLRCGCLFGLLNFGLGLVHDCIHKIREKLRFLLKSSRRHDDGQVFSGLVLLGNVVIKPVKLLFTFILGFLALLWGDVGIFVVLFMK
jgi:hypothetical protein